ncbi:hypothetical protein GCM10009347_15550 [Shewanella algicola]|uniref:Uncharacterized protein n=1 Tax=Shewanella algicola TaxID=640633 RepID=A0A9X1ZB31_9GAMM|nr:hypothetical protein [Shewanella algicola]MCL1105200.1 hypothetical protein [Shewanella algicola]GGP49371.1 hypothetical protein GCM10009347_15550 [Shewanella algicola]
MKYILPLVTLLSCASSASAHQLAFNELTPVSAAIKTEITFELSEMDMIKQYHYRAQYFDIEKWMMSKQLVLHNDHVAASDAQSTQTKQLQQPIVELEEYGGFHGVIDPFTKLQDNNANSPDLNSVTNRINIAGLVAVSMCNAYASINIKDQNNNLMPKFIAPNSFLVGINPETAQQSDYRLTEGLTFSCVYKNVLKPVVRDSVREIKLQQPLLKKGG